MADVIEIKGMDDLIRKLNSGFINKPLRNFLNRGGIVIQSKSREQAPVDRGRLRSDISTETDKSNPPIWSHIGPKVFYGPYQEFGTGTQSDAPGGGGGRHWPPGGALEGWAGRHGISGGGFAVARAIGLRGGLRPKRYMRGGLEDSVGEIKALLPRLADEIEQAAKRA